MKFRGMAVAVCVATLSFAACAGTPTKDGRAAVAVKPGAAVYIDGIGFTDILSLDARGKSSARSMASGFPSGQSFDLASRPLDSQASTGLSNAVFSPSALVIQYSAKPAAVGTAAAAGPAPSPAVDTSNDQSLSDAETYAPVLAGLGVLGFLAMRRKSN